MLSSASPWSSLCTQPRRARPLRLCAECRTAGVVPLPSRSVITGAHALEARPARPPARARTSRRLLRRTGPLLCAQEPPPPPEGSRDSSDSIGGSDSMTPSPASLLLAAGVLLSLIAYGAVHREELSTRLQSFAASLESSPWGAAEFMAAYILCEMVGVPAVPLTMSSGAIFGPVRGTAIVSLAGLTAAGAAFLVARHLARDRFAHLLASSPKWQAVDSALGQHSFKVITLLRLSPLFPFALSNYAFGLTRLGFWPYIAGSWLGMLPGTAMYVYAGSLGRDVLTNGLSDVADLGVHSVPLVVGGLMAVGSAGLVGKLVADAMEQGGKQEQGAGDGKASDAAAPADEAQRDDALSGKR